MRRGKPIRYCDGRVARKRCLLGIGVLKGKNAYIIRLIKPSANGRLQS